MFSAIFHPEIYSEQTLRVPSAMVYFSPLSVFPVEANGEAKNMNVFSSVEDFSPFWRHLGTKKIVGIFTMSVHSNPACVRV